MQETNHPQANQSVVICGANGYVGTHLVSALSQKDFAVKCLVRLQSDDTASIEDCGAEIIRADLSGSKPFKPSLIEELTGSSMMVNLVGSIAPKRGESLDSLHAAHTAKLINLCNACNIQKMVMVTALGTSESADSKYHASKWKAEQELINSGLCYVILQPSLIYGRQVGPRDSKLVKRFMELINDRPVVPLVGGGHNLLQPIFIEDLVQCIETSLAPGEHDNHIFELGGPETMELRKFVELLMDGLGQTKPFIDMPIAVARFIAAVCELTQESPTLSKDQVTLTLKDNICTHNALEKIFHIKPTSVSEGIQSYSTRPLAAVNV
jgi:NADH dehydrogenase